MSSLEQPARGPASRQSGDSLGAGRESAARAAHLVRRRHPFTGRVTYTAPSRTALLVGRVPRPILVTVSVASLAAGLAVSGVTAPLF